MKVKNSAIIYTGYDYQTLQGINLLSEWLHSPTKYRRVAFEADRDNNETPEGIDDIVCERPDGIKDFWQVKFTPSPEKDENHLTWDWLLKKTGKTDRSRSILKKLFDAIRDVSDENLGDVVLLTNKRPDRLMESCLFGMKINFSKIVLQTQIEIIRQLGSSEAANVFFSKLTVQHSDGDYHTTNRSIRAELLKFSDDAGVERLIARSREWAMFQNNPPENGWIYLHHVREILSPKRPDPIPEIFSLSKDYCLPDIDFHETLLAKITVSKGDVITLTGQPGAGKSTYLSFLLNALENNDIPLIRHHYFLSLNDTTDDRLSPRVVAESLLYQINKFHKKSNADTSKPENLRNALISCANYYKSKGKPFVVLIDGLDHVWRDNAKNKKPLDETFRQLLPVTDNLVILVGTQPVGDELLPSILLDYSPKLDWYLLPEMSGNAIYKFLKIHIYSNRLFMNCHDDQMDDEIKKSARALIDITNGYPLHVIYSVEFLSKNGLELSLYQIEKLPPCSDGNITTYYSNLWKDLTYRQKDVLHLCSGFQFFWPRQAIGFVVKDEHDYAPSVDAVAHMLSDGISGSRPFHESLVVFVRNQKEHQDQINRLLPCVCDWLASKASIHLNDNWYWSSLARMGDSSKLRDGITRNWVLDKIIMGMPVKSCIRLLSEAEKYAFDEMKYAEAYKHRELKTRLINGPKYQTWDATNLKIFSLISADKDCINEIVSSQNEYSPLYLSILAIALWYRAEFSQAKLLSIKAFEGYRAKEKIFSSRDNRNDGNEVVTLIKSGVLTDSFNYDSIFNDGKFSNWSEDYVASFRNACCTKKDISLLFRAWSFLPRNSIHTTEIELDLIRLSILEDAEIISRPEYKHFRSQSLSLFSDRFSKGYFACIVACSFIQSRFPVFKIETSSNYHNWFFSSLCFRLSSEGNYSWLPVNAISEREDISLQYDLINTLVNLVANELIKENKLSFDFVCSIFPSEPALNDNNNESRRFNILLNREWIKIAADCHLITKKSEITYKELKNTIDANEFNLVCLRLWYKESSLNLLTSDAAELLINLEVKRQSTELEETIKNSNAYLELSQIAFQHNNTLLFERCLRKTWDFVLGYFHHKDMSIFNVFDAVKYISENDPDNAVLILERISPIVSNISKFTDGDETRHAEHYIPSLLAKLNPQTTASIYNKNLVDGEWYYAEEAFFSLLKQCNFSSPITRHLFLTGLHSSCYKILTTHLENGDANAIKIREDVEDLLGINVQSVPKKKHSTADEYGEKITLLPLDYPPEQFEELVIDLKGKYSTSDFWKTWYKHWREKNKEYELLQYLIPHIATFTDRLNDKRYLLDLLFISQKKLNGKTKAFDLLVAAHNAMNGWSEWYESSENTFNRLKVLSQLYPSKIDEFIKKTTLQSDSWKDQFGDLIIPKDKLVFLLSQSGRNEEALELTLAMVEGLEDSVRNLKLTKPAWDWRRDDSIDEALTKSLVSMLKQPIPSIKLWVMEQLAVLLVSQYPKIEELLKKDLANRKQESECIEVLCVFLVAKFKGYICPTNLGLYVNARSVLSDLILNELISNSKELGVYAYPFSYPPYLDGDNHRFEYFQGSHVQLVYNSIFEEEEQRTGIPFTQYFQSEWNKTFEYQPLSETAIDYFMSEPRFTGQFYTQASHRGRSAYLRTIEVAKQFYPMPDSYASNLSIPALPIEPAYIGLIPRKPTWLPEWKNEISPDKDNLIHFVKDVLAAFIAENEFHDLLALSMPIKLEKNLWVDLTIVKTASDLTSTSAVQIEDRIGCSCYGNLLDSKLTYTFNPKYKSENTVLAVTPYPFMRFVHFHTDLESRSFHIPKCNIYGKNIIGSSLGGVFCYTIDETKIGFSSYWYNDWLPAHPKEIRSLCGTYTAIQKSNYANWLQFKSKEKKYFYTCKAKVFSSKDMFRDFETKELTFNIKNN